MDGIENPHIFVYEKDFQRSVEEVAQSFGWATYHTYDSRRSTAGFSDHTMVRQGRLIFAELKTQKGIVRKSQKEWLDMLREVEHLEVYLWRPSDWPLIESILK